MINSDDNRKGFSGTWKVCVKDLRILSISGKSLDYSAPTLAIFSHTGIDQVNHKAT